MDVICPGCGGVYHETTKHYDANRPATGKMFRLKYPYGPGGYNWSTFPQDPAVRFADLECPQCGSCYVGPDGRVKKLIPDTPDTPDTEEETLEQGPEKQEEAEDKKVKKRAPRKARGKK